MFSEELIAFSKEILNLNKLPILNQGKSLLFDCNYIIKKFNSEDLKKIIKMFLFCVGIRRYNFEKILYLKVDLDIIDIETIRYIANLIRFTGRKNQVKLMIKINNRILQTTLEELKQIPEVEFYINFRESILKKDNLANLIIFEEEDLIYQDSLKDFELSENITFLISLSKDDWINNKKILKYALSKTNFIKITKSLSELTKFSIILSMENFRKEILELYNSNI